MDLEIIPWLDSTVHMVRLLRPEEPETTANSVQLNFRISEIKAT